MIKNILLVLSLLIFGFSSYAQIDGHSCGFDHARKRLAKEDPNYIDNENQFNQSISDYIANKKMLGAKAPFGRDTIPVVFHILHNDGPENISNEQAFSAIDRLNECFNKANSELGTVQAPFVGLTADVEVTFILAKRAPNGQCFNGITRTKTTTTSVEDEQAQLNAVINGNDVYQGNWPGNMYLNIFVCDVISSPGAAAYAYFPNNGAMREGVWSQHTYIGKIGTSTEGRSGTVVHELGHWFGLSHTWGNANLVGNDPIPGNCSSTNDYVDDTPYTIGNKSCTNGINTCSGDNAYWLTNYGVADMIDNVENFMEYSYCFKMFTEGQKDRMKAVLASTAGGRRDLWQHSNLIATGVLEAPSLCKADFSSDKIEACVGDVIQFTDMSYSTQNQWTWNFNGGNVVGSINDENPSVMFDQPGEYTVSLEVSDGSNVVSSTKTNYIKIFPAPVASPFIESFESFSNFPTEMWGITEDYSNDYRVVTNASVTGSQSMRLTNTSNRAGRVYELNSSTIDVSDLAQPAIYFKYAHAKRKTSNKDDLAVYISNDCGETYSKIEYVSSSSLPTSDVSTSSFLPTSDEWELRIVDNIPEEYKTENFRMKFVFTSDGGNHLFLEDINVRDLITVDVADIIKYGSSFSIFPNPSSGDVNVNMTLPKDANVLINVYDVVGRKLQIENFGSKQSGEFVEKISTSNLDKGTYIFEILVDGVSISSKKVILN